MLLRLGSKLREKKRAWARTFGRDITDPKERRWSVFHSQFVDFGVLRHLWHNSGKVAEGVYRSNQPGHRRLVRLKAAGIDTILNLRGARSTADYLFERESCDALGIRLVSIGLHARKAPRRTELLALFDAFRTLPRPFLMHCKSGADRAGLASALYLMAQEGADLARARRELHLRYLHLSHTATGILDHVLDSYEARLTQEGPIGIEEWVETEYDPVAIEASFSARQGRR